MNKRSERYDVYIGRPSVWGNPFVIGRDGDRKAVLRKYAAYLNAHPDLIQRAKKELRGRVLGCFCKPQECHGDILAAVADGDDNFASIFR